MSDPIPMLLWCPSCKERHIDVGEFATKVHHTHSCQTCGLTWRPSVVPTVGVQFLPGFKDNIVTAEATLTEKCDLYKASNLAQIKKNEALSARNIELERCLRESEKDRDALMAQRDTDFTRISELETEVSSLRRQLSVKEAKNDDLLLRINELKQLKYETQHPVVIERDAALAKVKPLADQHKVDITRIVDLETKANWLETQLNISNRRIQELDLQKSDLQQGSVNLIVERDKSLAQVKSLTAQRDVDISRIVELETEVRGLRTQLQLSTVRIHELQLLNAGLSKQNVDLITGRKKEFVSIDIQHELDELDKAQEQERVLEVKPTKMTELENELQKARHKIIVLEDELSSLKTKAGGIFSQ